MATKGEATVYVVVYAAPGCVPDDPTNNACFSSRARARAYIAEERRDGKGTAGDYYRFDIIEMTRTAAEREGYEIL